MIDELPEGWTVTNIASLFSELRDGRVMHQGWSPQCERDSSTDEKEWAVLKTTSIQEGDFQPEHNKRLPTALNPEPLLEVASGDILLTCAGPRVRCGVVCLVRSTRPRLMISGKMYRFRANNAVVTSEFLELTLRSPTVSREIDSLKTGISDSGVNLTQAKFKELEVLLPPQAEQRRIVAKIEELTARSRAARAALAEVPTLLERFRQSVLASAFRGDLTADWRAKNPTAEPASVLLDRIRAERRKQWETKYPKKKYVAPEPIDDSDLPELPEGWCWATADLLCSQITDGEHIQPKYQDSGRPMLTAKHVRDGYVSQEGAGLIGEEDYKRCRARCAPATGDILIVSVGATTGRTAVVGQESDFALVRSVLLLKPLIQSDFFLFWTKSPFCFQWMTQASGATAQAHLYINDTKRMPVPLAPEQESRVLCRSVSEMLLAHTRQLQHLEVLQQEFDALDQSILVKAFRGELVPQDPADEPVSALLERIRAEREKAEPVSPARRPRARAKS